MAHRIKESLQMLLQHFMLQQTRLSKEGIDELTLEVKRTCQFSCVTSQT